MHHLILSICMMGRNDNYCGDFLYRMETAVNFMARNIRALNLHDKIEIVIADWGSEVKLSDVLNLIPEAWTICRFVYVSPETALSSSPKFNSALAANTAFRRAAGEYIMFTPADVFMPAMSLKNLIEILTRQFPVPFAPEETYMLIKRKYIPWQLLDKKPDMAKLEDFLLKNTHLLWDGQFYPGLNGNMGAMLMHRKFYEQSRGFDERLKGWGWWDIELGLRINLNHRCAELSYFGIFSYDMDQNPALRSKDINTNANPHNVVNMNLQANGENWGLADKALEVYQCLPKPMRIAQFNISNAVNLTRNAFLNYLCDKNIINQIFNIFGQELQQDQEWAALYLLAYYAAIVKPLVYMEFGFGRGAFTNVAAACQPCIEILGINDLQPERFYQYPHNISMNLKNKFNYVGNMRYVPGDMTTAIERLEKTEGKISSELVLFRPDILKSDHGKVLQSVLGCLPLGGAMIYTTVNPAMFDAIDRFFTQSYPEHIYLRSRKYKTAVFINKHDPAPIPPDAGLFGETLLEKVIANG